LFTWKIVGKYSVVSITIHYGLDSPGIESHCSQDWPWDPPSLLCNGYQGCSPRVKRPGLTLTTQPH
jgi:hypothetical protein